MGGSKMPYAKDYPAFLDEWQNIVEILAAVMRVPVAVITHFSFPKLDIVRTNTSLENPLKAGMAIEMTDRYCEEVMKSRQSMLIPDARVSERWRNSPTAKSGYIAYLGYPIMNPQGDVYGSLCVFDNKENHFSPEMAQLMERLKSLVEAHLLLWIQNQQLESQLQEISALRGILPMCAKCKCIRNDQGYWEQVDHYIMAHSDAEFTHGLCPKCISELYPGYRDEIASEKNTVAACAHHVVGA